MKITSLKKLTKSDIEFDDVKQWYDKNMALGAIDLDDKEVYKYVYHEGHFPAIFQCTSEGAQRFFIKAKPQSIIDVAALTSIYRPGPLAANVDKLWLKHEKEPFDWGHPLINDVLKETRGLLVFQESVMQLANIVGGFPMEKCDEVRRAIMKRSISGGEAAKAAASEMEDTFVKGAMSKGIPEDIAKKAYQTILFMSGYGFNQCCTVDSEVNTYNKNGVKCKKQMKDVTPGDLVLTRDESTKLDILTLVKQVHHNGKKKVVKVTLKTGQTIKCTMDHKFRTVETGEMLPLWLIHKKGLSIVVNDAIKHSEL